MTTAIDNRRDILLLLLYSPGKTDKVNEPIIGRTRIVKMLFLFKEEVFQLFKKDIKIDEEKFYSFFPWDFGPFSRDVYDDLTFFVLRKFIDAKESDEEAISESAAEWEKWLSMSRSDSNEENITEYDEEIFTLTKKGLIFAQGLYEQLSVEQKRILKEFKSRIVKAPLRALLKYVYENYEHMTTKSRIRGEILGNRG